MFEEKYKGKTVGEINQAIETLSKALSTASDPREREQIQAEIDYLNTFDRSAPISSWEATKKEDTAEGILANNPTSQEIIENAPNTLTQGLQAKGNRGDNKVDMKYDPSYHDAKSTAEVVEEQKNKVDENTNSNEDSVTSETTNTETTTTTLEDKKGGGEDDKKGGGKKGGGKDDKKDDEDEDEDEDENKNKGRYKSSMYGILDAMRNGDIDKSTGIYFMLDALSKAARNTGIDIGNIGAQFTGGTVRNDYQDSLWNQRKNKMFENEVTSELNTAEGTDAELKYKLGVEDLKGKGFANEQANAMMKASRRLGESADKFRAEGNETLAGLYDILSTSAASGNIDAEEIAGVVVGGILETPEGKEASKEIIELLSSLGQTVNSTLSGVNNAVNSFSNGINKVISFFTGNK